MTRRVITGVDADGRSIIFDDADAPAHSINALPGWCRVDLWGSDTEPTVPGSGVAPDWQRWFPRPGGFRAFIMSMVPAEDRAAVDGQMVTAEIDRKWPGYKEDHVFTDPARPGMHLTPTFDIGIVLEGTVTMEMDNGDRRDLRTGDVVIQNGTAHAWHNTSGAPCRVVFFMLGAHGGPASG